MFATHRLLAATVVLSAVSLLACTGAVNGERRTTGECPKDAVCAQSTPYGLIFMGQHLYDDGSERLGPVLVEGTFELNFYGEGVPNDYDVVIEPPGVFVADALDADTVLLKGMDVGTASISIVERGTGALYDRLTLEAVEVVDVEVSNVVDVDRTVLYAGCEEMVGIRLIAAGEASGTLRAFDQDVQVQSAASVEQETFAWDCFTVDVPEAESEVDIEVHAGGQVYLRSFVVAPLDGASCPELPTD